MIFSALTSDEGRMGVRIDELFIQGSKFVTREGVFPSLRLTMRLITTEVGLEGTCVAPNAMKRYLTSNTGGTRAAYIWIQFDTEADRRRFENANP